MENKCLKFDIEFGVDKNEFTNTHIICSDDFLRSVAPIIEIIKEINKNISNNDIQVYFDYSEEASFLQKFIICTSVAGALGLGVALPFALSGKSLISMNIEIKDNDLLSNNSVDLSFIPSNKKIINNRSKIYQNLKHENFVNYKTTYNNKTESQKVNKEEFQNLIVDDIESSNEFQTLNVKILSPYLDNKTSKKWKAEYIGMQIDFKVKDKNFLNELESGKINISSQPELLGKFKIIVYKDYEGNYVKSEYELIEVINFGSYQKTDLFNQ